MHQFNAGQGLEWHTRGRLVAVGVVGGRQVGGGWGCGFGGCRGPHREWFDGLDRSIWHDGNLKVPININASTVTYVKSYGAVSSGVGS